jgi:hypothetical protein
MISNYTRDNSFFQSLFETNSDITYKDFDNEINNLVDYLNRKIVTSINNISQQSYNGVIGNNNHIIRNIGNGNVTFDSLKDINYQNNGIDFDKIDNNIDPYSLLFINSKSEIMYHSIKYDNFGLGGIFGNFNNHLFYQYSQGLKIEGKNFYDKVILANNIDVNTITSNHINNDGKNYLVNNIQVGSRHIVNNSISNTKIANMAITYDKLHPDIKTFRERADVFLTYQNNSITFDKIKDNSFDMRLISTNLNKFGKGILHKAVIPLNSVVIAKPDQYANETIDTYKLCIYSISNAYQLNTYQNPQPDKVYINPAYIEKLDLYNNVSKQLIDANNYLNQLYTLCIAASSFISIDNFNRGKGPSGEDLRYFFRYWDLNYDTFYQRALNYDSQLTYYNNTYQYLVNINNDLQKIPKNIYTPIPLVVYQKLEAVPNTKVYKKNANQWSIKSNHLKDNSFNIINIPDRINYNNVPSNKFINKSALHINLQKKLSIV